MARRQIDFIQSIETSTTPAPGTPSNDSDIISKGYADSQYAARSSWYDKQVDKNAIRAIASSDRFNGQVVFDYTDVLFYYFDSTSALADDDDLVLQPDSGTGRWLQIQTGGGGGSGDSLIETFDTTVSTLLAANSISDREALCMQIHNGSGSDEFKVFKCDADVPNRRGFVGIAREAVSTTQGSYTYTISAAYVSGNSVPITINGRSYVTTYASSSDATLQALATLIALDPDVYSATVTVVGGNQTGTDDRVITILTSNGINGISGAVKLNITGTTVTGGASQPTVTIANPTPSVQTAIDIHHYGPIDGMSGLTPGGDYYVSTTAGAITSTPTDGNPIFVGKALSSTVLFVDPSGKSFNWVGSEIFVRSHGTSTTADSGGTQDSEHFNYSTWSAGTTSTNGARVFVSTCDNSFQARHHQLDGRNTSGTLAAVFQKYDKSTWSALTNRGTAKEGSCSISAFAYYNSMKGSNGVTTQTSHDRWNGSSWSSATAFSNSREWAMSFSVNSLINVFAGNNSSGVEQSDHETKNSGDTLSTATSFPISANGQEASNSASSTGLASHVAASANSTTGYKWNGTTWSSALTSTYTVRSDVGGVQAYSTSRGYSTLNGGNPSASSPVTNTDNFNGSSYSSTTASSLARGRGPTASVI